MASVNSAVISLAVNWACNDITNAIAARFVAGTYPPSNPPLKTNYAAGSGSGAIDQMYVGQVTVPASSTATLTLTSLTDPANNAVNFARVTKLIFVNNGAAAVTMGGGTHPLGAGVGTSTDTIALQPGDVVMYGKNDATGYVVTSGTHDTLTFTNGSGSACVVDVLLFGRAE